MNELILNAVKHGGQQNGNVRIQLREGKHAGMVRLTIANNGQFLHDPKQVGRGQNGLQLVAALMPGYGARMLREESDGRVGTVLELESPIIFRLPVGPA